MTKKKMILGASALVAAVVAAPSLQAAESGSWNFSVNYIPHLVSSYKTTMTATANDITGNSAKSSASSDFKWNWLAGGAGIGYKWNNGFMVGVNVDFYSKEVPDNNTEISTQDVVISGLDGVAGAGGTSCAVAGTVGDACKNTYSYQSSGFDVNTYMAEFSYMFGNLGFVSPFVKVGVGGEQITYHPQDTNSDKLSQIVMGWEVGGGVAFNIAHNTNVAVSYNYVRSVSGDASTDTITSTSCKPSGDAALTTCDPASAKATVKFDEVALHTLKLSLIYSFGLTDL